MLLALRTDTSSNGKGRQRHGSRSLHRKVYVATRYRRGSPDLGYLGRQPGQPHWNQASIPGRGANGRELHGEGPKGPNGRFLVGVDQLQNLEHAWAEFKTLWRCPGADPPSLRLELVMCKAGELRTTPPDNCFGCHVVASSAGYSQTCVDLLPAPWLADFPRNPVTCPRRTLTAWDESLSV
jgi:hypothetical protein